MVNLLRKTTQTTYTFTVSHPAEYKEYIVNIVINDPNKSIISSSVSVDGVEVENEDERIEVLEKINQHL